MHTHTHDISRPQLRLRTALLLPALPKVHSDAEGGLQSSLITSHRFGYAEAFSHPLRATANNNQMFSYSSPATHIASIRRFDVRLANTSDPFVHVDQKTAQMRCLLCVFMPSSLPS